MKSHLGTVLTMGLAWLAGAVAAFGSQPILPWWERFYPDMQPPLAVVIGVFGAASLCAARIASSRRAGVLEIAGILAFAGFPLMVMEAVSFHPDFAIPAEGVVSQWLDRRYDLHSGYVMAEATALLCLVAGAVGLLRSAVRWPLAVWLGALGSAAGLVLGGVFFENEGWMLGGPLGLAAVVFPVTAASVRGPRAVAGRGARCLAVLAVAMGAVLASDLSRNLWAFRHEGGPWPYYSLWPLAEQVTYATRVLLVQLGGCGVALAFALSSGRRGARPRGTSSGGSVPVVLVAFVCLFGSTVHLQQQRVDVFNWQWSRAREIAAERLLCGCEDRWKRVPRLGRPLNMTPLPWPLRGRVGYAFQRSVVRVNVDLTGPSLMREDGELERLRALPVLRLGPTGHLAATGKSTAPEYRVEAPDNISYGEFLRGLGRAIDVHDTRVHMVLDDGPAPSAP